MTELPYLLAVIAIVAPAVAGIACGGLAGFFASLFYYAALALCAGAVFTSPLSAFAGFLVATGIFAFVCWGMLDNQRSSAH